VRVHYYHQASNELLLVHFWELFQQISKVVSCKGQDIVPHVGFLPLVNPFLVVRSEEKLVELNHESEASSLVEEVKLLIVFVGFALQAHLHPFGLLHSGFPLLGYLFLFNVIVKDLLLCHLLTGGNLIRFDSIISVLIRSGDSTKFSLVDFLVRSSYE